MAEDEAQRDLAIWRPGAADGHMTGDQAHRWPRRYLSSVVRTVAERWPEAHRDSFAIEDLADEGPKRTPQERLKLSSARSPTTFG